jgi:two-component system sensor histidine kinase BaeS
MMRSLRVQLALSNTLPILLLMPLLSLYLLYSLESFFTPKLLTQLSQQARLLYDQVQADQTLVADALAAQRFMTDIARKTDARVLLLSKSGVVLASTRPEDADRIGIPYADPTIVRALQGEVVQGIGPGFTTEVIYVVMPIQQEGVTTGALRLSYEVDDVRRQFSQMWRIILGGVALTVLLGLGIGGGLALTITRPLRLLGERIQAIASGNYEVRAEIVRRDEVGMLAQNINQMAVRLEEARVARRQQLAAVVHELARPLTGMRAAVETLLDGAAEDGEMRTPLLIGIGEELVRLERLIGALQDVQRRGLKPLQIKRSPVSLERVSRASVTSFEPVAAQLGVTLSMKIPANLPLISADEDRLIQVLTNLLDNALKFTPRDGEVTIQVIDQHSAVWVAVTDTGIGIAPHELPYLFQQFYRGDEKRTPEKQGMGLGLTICREIIEAHGGQIWVESTSGQGARFSFILPKDFSS